MAHIETVKADDTTTGRVGIGRFLVIGLLTIIVSVLANVAARFLMGLIVSIPAEFPPLQYGAVISITSMGVLGAVLAFAIVCRWLRKSVRTYQIVAVIALLISLIPNTLLLFNPQSLPIPGMSAVNSALLMVLHVVAALVSVGMLTALAGER